MARRLAECYEFADPSIVRAISHLERLVAGRDMLLEGRFWRLCFRLGCRVTGVIDEQRTEEGRPVRVWGYRTLQDHLELGETSYEVWKWLDDGADEFRSQPSPGRSDPQSARRLGSWLRRGVQKRFPRRSCQRMLQLTEAEVAGGVHRRAASR